jgi:hypothetical protein
MEQITIQTQFCYDNMRNVRICEPCFMRLSKIVAPTSHTKEELGSIIPDKEEVCKECQREALTKRLKMADTTEGWLACITNCQDIEQVKKVWGECDSIAWDRGERKKLGFKYVAHLAQLESVRRWGNKTKIEVMEKAILALPNYTPPPF